VDASRVADDSFRSHRIWCQTGGGDLFDDSETMLRPTRIPSSYPGFLQGDDIESATQFCIQNGMPASYLLFTAALFISDSVG